MRDAFHFATLSDDECFTMTPTLVDFFRHALLLHTSDVRTTRTTRSPVVPGRLTRIYSCRKPRRMDAQECTIPASKGTSQLSSVCIGH